MRYLSRDVATGPRNKIDHIIGNISTDTQALHMPEARDMLSTDHDGIGINTVVHVDPSRLEPAQLRNFQRAWPATRQPAPRNELQKLFGSGSDCSKRRADAIQDMDDFATNYNPCGDTVDQLQDSIVTMMQSVMDKYAPKRTYPSHDGRPRPGAGDRRFHAARKQALRQEKRECMQLDYGNIESARHHNTNAALARKRQRAVLRRADRKALN